MGWHALAAWLSRGWARLRGSGRYQVAHDKRRLERLLTAAGLSHTVARGVVAAYLGDKQ